MQATWRRGAFLGGLALATGLWGAALAQTAPAEVPETTVAATPAPRAEAGTYLAARAAGIAADLPVAADYFARALDRDPSNPRLLEGALSANLGLGRLEEARALADRMIEVGIDSPTANLTRAVSFAAQEDWRALLSDLEAGRSAGPLVDGLERAWAWAGLGDQAQAQSAFDELAAAPGMRAFGLYHKALALAASGDLAGAEAILALPESEGMQRSRRSLLAHVQVLGALGRAEEALALLDSVPALASDAALLDMRAQLETGEPVEFTMIASPAEGLGEAYLNIAALLAEGEDAAVALLYTRASLLLDPSEAEAALLAAGLLERLEQPALAREVYGLVPPDHPAYVAAELGRARVLRSEEEEAAALEVLSRLAQQRSDLAEVQSALGDLLRSMERWAEAEAAYDKAVALQDADSTGLWYLHFMRALAREAQDDWTGTEADLRRALELNPEQPQVLNHLGYSLVERGEKLPEALSLLEQAVALRPDSGAIVDSLGWAFFKLGRYPQAVTELEKASSLLPTDPVINDHLGDAYWAVGRQREARFQWSRALSLEPTPEDAETIRLKLADGLTLSPVAAEAASLPLDASGG